MSIAPSTLGLKALAATVAGLKGFTVAKGFAPPASAVFAAS